MPPYTREQLIAAGKKAMAANDLEAAEEIADMLDAMEAEPATPTAAPGADDRAAYMARFKPIINFRDGSRLMKTPEGGEILVAKTFTEDDPKKIKRLLKPYRLAEENRAKAAALRKRALEANARDQELIKAGLVRERKRSSPEEFTAAQLEARALRQEATFYGLLNASIEQKLGERSEFATNPLAAGSMQLLKGTVFGGQYVDEALGAAMQQPGMTQMGINAADIVRGAQAKTERDYPIASAVTQVAGGIGSAIATPGLVAAGAPRGVGLGSKMLSGGVRGGAIGGAEGAVSGFGAGTDLDSRLETAGQYGAMGAGLGGGIGALAPAAAAGIQAGGRALGVLEDVNAPSASARVAPPGATPAAAPTEEAVMEDVVALLRKASTGGMGSEEAVEKLASMAKIDPRVAEAADRLGFQLPPDIFVDHTQLQRAIGLTRSRQGSVAEASFLDAVRNAAQKADEAIATLDGSPDLSVVSERVKNSLTSTRDALKTAATSLFKKVDKIVPARTSADTTRLKSILDERVADLGGDPKRLSPAEQKLYGILKSGQPATMALLQQEKNTIGQALRKQATEYGTLDEATLKRLYGAMSEDQLATAGRVAGQSARDDLRLAIQTEAKARALENRIIKTFGSEVEGSIASKLRTAITSGTKGDIAALNKLLQVIPDNLKKESVASAISAMSRTRGSDGFSFATFETLMKGLRNNSEVYNAVIKAMGPQSGQLLEDLYLVSQKVAAAQRSVTMTGKANQSMLQALTAEGLVSQAFKAGGKAAVQGSAAATGAGVGGAPGAALGAAIAQSLFKGGPEREALESIASVLRSEKFQTLLAKAAQGQPRQPLIREMVATPEFRKFSALTGLKDPENWLAGTLGASKGAQVNLGDENQRISDLMANGYSRPEAEEIVRLSNESIQQLRYNPETGEIE